MVAFCLSSIKLGMFGIVTCSPTEICSCTTVLEDLFLGLLVFGFLLLLTSFGSEVFLHSVFFNLSNLVAIC